MQEKAHSTGERGELPSISHHEIVPHEHWFFKCYIILNKFLMIAGFQDYFLEKVLESHCLTCMAHETRRPSFPLFKHTKVGLHEPRRPAQPNPAQGRFQSRGFFFFIFKKN